MRWLLLAGLSTAMLLAGKPLGLQADPLQLIPQQADLVLQVQQPRQFLETIYGLDVVRRFQQLPPVQEALDGTGLRRLQQLLTHIEKRLGAARYDLLERLGGQGVVLAIQGNVEPAPTWLVLQGRDEALATQFFALSLELIAEELARQETPQELHRACYRDCDTARIGNDLFMARAGPALILCNKNDGLKAALDLFRDGEAKSLAGAVDLVDGRKQVPANALAWIWVNLKKTVHPSLGEPDTPNPLLVLGAWVDVLRRASYLTLSLSPRADGLALTVRMPKGLSTLPPESAMHVPPAGQPGARPLLVPRGTLLSSSYYLDLAKFWEHRERLLDEEGRKGLEQAQRDLGKFLAGMPLSKLLAQSGVYQRFVVVSPQGSSYQARPALVQPAFALVAEMREPDALAKALDTILRTLALGFTTQVRLKLVEEQLGDWKLVGYRFDETSPLPADTDNVRFNFSPCYARVGNQFLISSTLELGRELVGLLDREAKAPATSLLQTFLARISGEGVAAYLRNLEDQLLVQTVLQQAATPEEARQQVRDLLELVRQAGGLRMEANYREQEFRFELVYSPRQP